MKKYLFLLRIRLAIRIHSHRRKANSAGLPLDFSAINPISAIEKTNK